MSADPFDLFARELAAAGARVSTVRLPSGAVDVTVVRGRDHVVVQGIGAEWGCSMNSSDAEALMGHEHVSATAEQALATARALLLLDTAG
ncbi:MAG: hypothetical protein ACT4RN_17565 [Pseudonocardia sp.]